MKVRNFICGVLVFLILVCLSQIFNIPPYHMPGGILKSDYFRNLDRKYEVVADSFMGIKVLARPEYAWLFLDEMEKKYHISVSVYNPKGREVFAPGYYSDFIDKKIPSLVNSSGPVSTGEVEDSVYSRIIMFSAEERCLICHNRFRKGQIVGAVKVSGPFSSRNFYSRERIIIFTSLSAVLVLMLIFVLRWQPDPGIKELFDK